MNSARRSVRLGFSLLEMVLALSLAMILLLALYLTLSTYINSAHVGRETLNEGEVARSIMSRIAQDVNSQLGAYDTRSLLLTTGMADPAAPPPTTNSGVPFNIGVNGDSTSLRLSVYRPEKPPVMVSGDPVDAEKKSELRRVNYWVIMNGGETLGLARREFKQATSQDIEVPAGDAPEQEKYLITKKGAEVKSVKFEYFDGMAWQEKWDGAAVGDGKSNVPIGPPAALKITVVLHGPTKPGTQQPVDAPELDQRLTFVQVVPLFGGNKFKE